MPLIPYEPFRNLENWKTSLDKFFNDPHGSFGFLSEFNNRIDIFENDHEVIAHCEIPGLEKKEDVHLHVDDQMLTIHGVVHRSHEIQEERLHRRERYAGKFQRSVTLPSPVSIEGTSATYKNGILEVRMPKKWKDSQKHIDVEFH